MILLQFRLPNDQASAFGRQMQLHAEAAADILASDIKLRVQEEDDLTAVLIVSEDLRKQLRQHDAECRILDEDEMRERGKRLQILKRDRMKRRGEAFVP